MHHHTAVNEPHIGQATICLWQSLSKCEAQAKKQSKAKKLRAEGVVEEDFELAMVESDEEMEDWEFYGEEAPEESMFIASKEPTSPQPFIIPPDTAPIHLRYPACPPSNITGRIPLTTEVCYSGYVYADQETNILSVNTTYAASLPSRENSTVYGDGYWGRKEPSLYLQRFDPHAPWLLYIPISHAKLRQPLLRQHRHSLWTEGLRTNSPGLPSPLPSQKTRTPLMSPHESIMKVLHEKRNSM